MAPRLSRIQRKELQNVIISKLQGEEDIKDEDIATQITGCTARSVRNARSNILQYGTIDAPAKTLGRPKEITENMWLAIRYELEQCPGLSQQALADFLFKQYSVRVSRATIGRGIQRQVWTKKVMDTVAKERNQELRNFYIEKRSHIDPKCMVFVDETGDDRRRAILKRGYAPKGVRPVQTKRFHRGKRVSCLPAYTLDGIIYSEVYEEYTNNDVFEAFLERLLPHCGRYPGPKSVVYMDNASWHDLSVRIKDMYAQAGVLLETQSPYSPDLNPIEYFFGSIKKQIESRAVEDEDLIQADFKSYFQMKVYTMGQGENGKRWAKGHFRKAQIFIAED